MEIQHSKGERNYTLVILTITICSFALRAGHVKAQYGGGGNQMSSGGGYMGPGYSQYGDADNGGHSEERPKLHLGIRLRIPAFKVDLPRFSLPKITVSAKIRQPDRPRTITLPEINLDTSSKLSQPMGMDHGNGGGYGGNGGGSYGGSGGYAASGSNYQPSHQMAGNNYGEKTQVFEFSTIEEHPRGVYSNSGASYGNQQQKQPAMQQFQAPTRHQQIGYSGSDAHFAYTQASVDSQRQAATVMPPLEQSSHARNADLGFNQPVYLDNAFVGNQEKANLQSNYQSTPIPEARPNQPKREERQTDYLHQLALDDTRNFGISGPTNVQPQYSYGNNKNSDRRNRFIFPFRFRW